MRPDRAPTGLLTFDSVSYSVEPLGIPTARATEAC